MPSLAAAAVSSRNSRRASGSRLATGSSRTSRSGRFGRASVSASWARWPPESRPARWRGVQAEPVHPVAPRGGVPARVEPRAQAQVVGDGQARRRAGRPARRNRPGRSRAPRPGCRRAPRCVPAVGAAGRRSGCSRVVLPAPFGPTRPTTRPAGHGQRAVAQRPAPPVPLGERFGLKDRNSHAAGFYAGVPVTARCHSGRHPTVTAGWHAAEVADAGAGRRGLRDAGPDHRHRAAPRGHGRRRRRSTAHDALERLAVTRYDVVVLDRDLPGVHGDEVCRRIVAGAARPAGC